MMKFVFPLLYVLILLAEGIFIIYIFSLGNLRYFVSVLSVFFFNFFLSAE